MPTLKKIVIQDFRNIALQELEFSPNINCIRGGNGEGKTNLLDAIWYLSMTKSAFSASDRFNFRHGCREFSLSGQYELPSGVSAKISMQVRDGGEKKLRRDGSPYKKISDHIGLIPIVMVSPADSAMVSESGELRRKFVNSVLSQMDPAYLSGTIQYNRLLAQRNSLLKDGCSDAGLLETFDIRLEALGRPICRARAEFTEKLRPLVAHYYEEISAGKESVDIEYSSDLLSGSLEDKLRSSRDRDLALRYTGAGLQRDDFLFTMDGHPIRRCGSQGQQKSFLVALKFAQYEIMKERCGYPPIMLLDDLFDKLDIDRVSNLLRMVSARDFGQIFLTDADRRRSGEIVNSLTSDRKHIETAGGVFSYADE